MLTLYDPQTRTAIEDAGHALAALNEVIRGQEPDAPVPTNVSSLTDMRSVIEALVADLRRMQGDRDRLRGRLARIARLELRGARDLIETQNWKRVADEMQAIAETALTKP
jgi:hypothetical protein